MAAAKRKFPDPRPLAPPRACGACGHDLANSPLNTPCPRCGWRPSIRCITCGYDLAGLDEDGPCPECATPIAESLRGDGLAYANSVYLRVLDRGLGMIRWGIGLVILTWIGGMLALLAISSSGVQVPSWVEGAVIAGLMLLSSCLYVGGWWTATTPDPRDAADGGTPIAMVARSGAVAIIALIASMLLLGWLANFRDVVVAMLLLVFVVQHGAGSLYLQHLAGRAANARAAGLARTAMAAISVVGVAWIVRTVLNATNIVPPAGGGGSALRLVASLAGLAMFVAAVVAVARQFAAAGHLRNDLARFLAQAGPR